MANKLPTIITAVILYAFIIFAVLGVTSLITMIAWNLVMPFLFHLPIITIWIAFAINVLIGLIKPTISVIKK